ncbi:hypothetical protein OS189_08955 [Sulfitobacter sp. F26169L]|uniref:hypothetical protein n=1 Tax=Sulfitobacter sp. F26169L TaxID=2996015 RepID=UPI002260B42F|nr:hypothetical protein [Sulfitobacter sp. F26169L]MCX7566468.1 hypothetical protein [Sulfitobacter sp. F26169L]
MTQPDRFDLDTALEAARANPPQMPKRLAEQIVNDAMSYQPRAPFWRRIMAAVGGPAGVSGMVTATIAGFWLGVAAPVEQVDPLALIGVVDALDQDEMSDLMGFDWYSDEG